MRVYTAALTLFASLALAQSASAVLIAADSFDYSNNGTSIVGQSSSSRTGFAASDAWTSPDSINTGVNFNSSGTNLSYGSLQSSGGSMDAFRTSNFTGEKAASLDSTTPWVNNGVGSVNEVYFSVLVNADGFTAANDQFFFGWDHQNAGGTGIGQRYFGFSLDSSLEIRAAEGTAAGSFGNGVTASTATGLNLAAGTNLLVFRVTDKTSGGSDEFQMWLNPVDLGNIGTADYSNTISNGLVQNNAGYGFAGFNIYGNYNAGSDGLTDSVLIDEFRLGTTMADVLPIPEPSNFALVGLALGAVVLFRRRHA